MSASYLALSRIHELTSSNLSSTEEGILNLQGIHHHESKNIHVSSFGRSRTWFRTCFDGSFERRGVYVVCFDFETLGQEALDLSVRCPTVFPDPMRETGVQTLTWAIPCPIAPNPIHPTEGLDMLITAL